MIFAKSVIGNSKLAQIQVKEVEQLRYAANLQDLDFRRKGQIKANEGIIPQDVYQEFDNVTVERFRSDDGDTFLNDLLPNSRSINIGKLVQKFRQASDSGLVQTSMTGQIGAKMDQTEFTYDGSIVPISDASFGRNWREWNAQRSEGFDALIDDQRETVAAVRRSLADQFMDGHVDVDGNAIVVDGLSWLGMRNDSRVASIDLGAGGINFDFTLNTNSGDLNKAAFIEVRDILWIDNKCERDVTYYISREIMSNWERKFSANYDSQKIIQELASLMGVKDIKVSSKLTGNQLMGVLPGTDSVRPIVGMGLNTVAMPRPLYNDNYQFVTWTATGWQVRTDFAGNTCASYASA